MEGLASSMAGPATQAQAPGGVPSVEEVAQLLMQGMPPEEIEAMGVPPEIIMQAIDMLEQQMAAQGGGGQPQPAQPQQGGGLAQGLAG